MTQFKQYNQNELFALNAFLRKRDTLVIPPNDPIAIVQIKFEYYLVRDTNGVDWMTRKEGNTYTKMFCLENWKRFDYGNKQPRYIRQRELANTKGNGNGT